MKMEEKTIYQLRLHEYAFLRNGNIRILRVHNGWIYQMKSDSGFTDTFVPFDKEEIHEDQCKCELETLQNGDTRVIICKKCETEGVK